MVLCYSIFTARDNAETKNIPGLLNYVQPYLDAFENYDWRQRKLMQKAKGGWWQDSPSPSSILVGSAMDKEIKYLKVSV
ncbi:hypothetical protein J6590_039985 [Homalodisca vitripennis]|nr:hypothetical protein J6590_039985 [Homalodisca vitripennis]